MTSSKNSLVDEVMERIARKHHSNNDVAQAHEQTDESHRQLIQALSDSTRGIFSTMCGWDVNPGPCTACKDAASFDASGLIGLSGAMKATIAVRFKKELLFAATQSFLGFTPTELGPDAMDLVGELTNMIGGNAKERLTITGISLGLPTIVAGPGHYIAFDAGLEITRLPFHCEHGSLCVEVAMT